MTATHPRGTMFDRSRGLESVHSGYLTRGQLLALIAHLHEWAVMYLDNENLGVSPLYQTELDGTPFSLNPGPYGPGGQGAPDDSSDTSASFSNISGSNHVEHRSCPPNCYHNKTALTTLPLKRRRQRGRSTPLPAQSNALKTG
jgi:hypothetical protein